MRGRRFPSVRFAVVLLAPALLGAFLYVHRVDNAVTAEDRAAIARILAQAGVAPVRDRTRLPEAVRFVGEVQRAVLEAAPGNAGIPFGMPREPAELLAGRSGLCYDRSRTIEKTLRMTGFEVRHAAVYELPPSGSVLAALASTRRPSRSHSVSEVLTPGGWMVVDSNARWLSLDARGNPVSIEEMRRDAGAGRIAWKAPFPAPIYGKPFTFVYGLYSRHGMAYPPYDAVPDVNYPELLENLRRPAAAGATGGS